MKIQRIAQAAGALLVTVALSHAWPTQAASVGKNPFQYYGDEIVFDVLRKGSPVGTHRVTFSRDGEDIVVDTKFNVTIKILVVPVYTYLYTSTERWRDGKLISLHAETDDNGEKSNVKVSRANDILNLQGSGGEYSVDGDTYPTTHWNSGVIGATRVINTITGKVNEVTMDNRGIETVKIGENDGVARHYAYQGDLATEVWYDDIGRWVKMRFPGKDGVMIEYKCRTCGVVSQKTGDAAEPDPRLAYNETAVE